MCVVSFGARDATPCLVKTDGLESPHFLVQYCTCRSYYSIPGIGGLFSKLQIPHTLSEGQSTNELCGEFSVS